MVHARGADPDPRRRGALHQQRQPCALGGGQEQVGAGEHTAPVGACAGVPVGVEERDRLPGGEHQAVAELGLVLGGLHRVPEAEVLGVDDVRAAERPARPQVAVARDARQRVARGAGRQKVPQRPHRLRLEVERCGVEPVATSVENHDLEVVGEVAPGAQVPGVRLVPADDHHPRAPAGAHRRASTQTFRRTNGSHASAASVRGRRLRRVHPDTIPIPGITDS